MANNTLPLVVLINANGHRDRLDSTTKIEFVFDDGRSIQVGFDDVRDAEDVQLKVQDVRSGTLSVRSVSTNTVTIRSERKTTDARRPAAHGISDGRDPAARPASGKAAKNERT